MLGSSKTYNTPDSPEPIWLANLILWLSPPDKVPLFLEIDKYDNPTLVKNPSRSFISFKTCLEIANSFSFRTVFKFKNQSLASSIVSLEISAISFLSILTAKVSNLSLFPLHLAQSLFD